MEEHLAGVTHTQHPVKTSVPSTRSSAIVNLGSSVNVARSAQPPAGSVEDGMA